MENKPSTPAWVYVLVVALFGLTAFFISANKHRDDARPKTVRERIESHLSGYDGSHPELEDYIKSKMNDASSYEHVETKFFIPKEETATTAVFTTTFRGKNGFGAKVLNTVRARCEIETGKVLEILE